MSDRVQAFLELAVQQGGSDLHLLSGQPPCIRINGTLHRIRFRTLSIDDMEQILGEFMTARDVDILNVRHAVDFGYEVPGLGRFRVNAYRHVAGLGAALRLVPTRIPKLDELGLPTSLAMHAQRNKGLTLVTGPTGSGKSTTLAAMVDLMNETQKGHIITIEDPIEFVHTHKSSVVSQREIGIHAPDFAAALRSALREDPDVVLVGELRDLESIALALTAAETGIQVLATLHTKGAASTIDRVVNVFPTRRQEQIRSMLADSLRLIICQQLVRTADGKGRLAACEVLVNTVAVSSMIRSGNTHKLDSVILAGGGVGMQSLDATLKDLMRRQIITGDEAYAHALDKQQFERHAAQREAA